jgi:hypothetical protein
LSSLDKFRFKTTDTIGAEDAAQDQSYLESCFVDTGEIAILRDCADHRRIVVGRTGSGKSALLIRFQDIADVVIPVKPESLSLQYISNSTILNYLMDLGVNLDIFFRLLWRHVLP